MSIDSRLPNFRNLPPSKRLDYVQQLVGLSAEDSALLRDAGALPIEIADGMIENVIGTDGTMAGMPGFSDVIQGSAADNRLEGRGGNDFLVGREGADTLLGGDGDDIMLGGTGNDTLDGGRGNNQMAGGAGADRFLVRPGDLQQALIEDFEVSADFLLIGGAFHAALVGGNFAAIGWAVTPFAGGVQLTAPGLHVTVLGAATLGDLLPRISPLA